MEDLDYEKQKLKQVEEQLDEIQSGEEKILSTLPKKYGNNPVLLADLMSATAVKISNIAKMKDKPYFARIDFKADSKTNADKFYIGKIGVLDLDGKVVITDWRAPVATLYYDSNLGNVEYDAPDGKVKGEMSLKRQIVIKKQEVESIFDVDSVSDDELLKPYLGASADNRLKNIVATIQGEQNDIIRKKLEQSMIVQGVAGSGKTTVALHRIAYLMYNHAKRLTADQFMVIGPNKFFINYISNVLPDLDAAQAVQFTYEELARQFVGEKLNFEDTTKKLSDIIDGKEESSYIRFKQSMRYKELLDNYLTIKEKYLFSNDGLVINNVNIITKQYAFGVYNSMAGNSINQRLEMTSKVIANRIKNDTKIYDSIKQQYDVLIQNEADIEKKKKLAKQSLDLLKELTSNGLEKHLKKYFSISNLKMLEIYREFIYNIQKFAKEDEVDIDLLKKNTLNSLKAKIVENEDIAALMYIKYKFYGNADYTKFRCVVVDEAQDFGKFSFYMLRTLMSQSYFSIFGDMAQGIYSYRGIKNWDEIKDEIFEGAEYLRLEKSYRTSIEIMNEANKISNYLGLGNATPVIRNAGPVIKTKVDKNTSQDYIAKQVKKYQEDGFKSIAIIYKDQKKMITMNQKLKEVGVESEIIYKDQENYNGNVCILTSYLSKGLEFDVVIIADGEKNIYQKENTLDMKLLYVAMTRALHKLEFVYEDTICELLDE